jgi:tripartite-type tricarboxylate transporter receptor subunit TctC
VRLKVGKAMQGQTLSRRQSLAAVSALWTTITNAAPRSDPRLERRTGPRETVTAWPARAIRLMVAYPPGGISDRVARSLAEPLAARLGVPVLVEHRPGAAGSLALEQLARHPADGHLLVFSAITPVVAPAGPQRAEAVRDIEPVAAVMETPVLVVGTPALAASRFEGLQQLARAAPGAVRWASSGIGTTGHLVLELVCQAADLKIQHIPYKGGGEQIQQALSGQFEVLSSNLSPAVVKWVHGGRLNALALGATQRSPVLPQVPTLAELGFPSANLSSLFGLFAAAGTPAELLDRLNAEIQAAIAHIGLQQELAQVGSLARPGQRSSFAAAIAQEARTLAPLMAAWRAANP